MNKKTKQILATSIMTLAVSLCIFSFLLLFIQKQGDRLEEKVKLLEENNQKEASYLSVNRIANETVAERVRLEAKFVDGEAEMITFLSKMEQLAPTFGLTLKTKNIDTVVGADKKQEAIKVVFAYTGEKTGVIKFTELIENLPYHSYVDSLSLKEINGDLWEGEAGMIVTTRIP